MHHFDDPHVASVSPVIVDAANTERVLSAGLSYSRGGRRTLVRKVDHASGAATSSVGPSSAAAFYRRAAINQIGGFCPAVGEELIDIDAALTLQRLGWTTAFESESRVACAHKSATRASAFAQWFARRAFVLASCTGRRLEAVASRSSAHRAGRHTPLLTESVAAVATGGPGSRLLQNGRVCPALFDGRCLGRRRTGDVAFAYRARLESATQRRSSPE